MLEIKDKQITPDGITATVVVDGKEVKLERQFFSREKLAEMFFDMLERRAQMPDFDISNYLVSTAIEEELLLDVIHRAVTSMS